MKFSQNVLRNEPSDSGPFTEEVKNYLLGKGDKSIDQIGSNQVWEGLAAASDKNALVDYQRKTYTREQLASDYIDVYQKISEGGF